MDVGSIHSFNVTANVTAASKAVPEKQPTADGFAVALSEAIGSQHTSGPVQIAPPGGSAGVANDLMRMLGGRNEGVNAAAASNGQSTKPESFVAELLRSAGAKLPDEESPRNNLAAYMHGLLQSAYGVK